MTPFEFTDDEGSRVFLSTTGVLIVDDEGALLTVKAATNLASKLLQFATQATPAPAVDEPHAPSEAELRDLFASPAVTTDDYRLFASVAEIALEVMTEPEREELRDELVNKVAAAGRLKDSMNRHPAGKNRSAA